jgi:peptidoglycan/LPS O-acetylase OafA/YrhL
MGAPARIRTVDGLRGLAALLVVFDHTVGDSWGLGAWSQQNHGITVFALLTGFLLSSRFLARRLDGRPRPSALAFLRARAARIFPGYWVALAIAALTIGLHAMGPGDGWRVVTLTQTFGTDTAFKGIPPTWSLSLFLSFYFALPAWAWWRSRSDRPDRSPASLLRREIAWLATLIPLSLAVRATSLTDPISPNPVFTLLGRADWFAIGMILAALAIGHQRGLLPSWARLPGRYPAVACVGALALTAGSAFIPVHFEELRDQLDTGAGALLVAAAVLHGPALRGPQRALESRAARALGRWSYGIFLWGYVVMKAISQVDPGISTAPHLALTIVGAVLLGAASWRFVEQPAARWLRARREPAADAKPRRALSPWRLNEVRAAPPSP